MNKLKQYLVTKYFPTYTHKAVLDENERLKRVIEKQSDIIREQNTVIRELGAEITGLKYAIRHYKITIGEVK